MADAPKIAGLKGRWVDLKAGTHKWCACGLSATQPFCDGSHKGTNVEPYAFVQEKAEKVILCLCKHTRSPPFCDGSHARFGPGDEFDEYV